MPQKVTAARHLRDSIASRQRICQMRSLNDAPVRKQYTRFAQDSPILFILTRERFIFIGSVGCYLASYFPSPYSFAHARCTHTHVRAWVRPLGHLGAWGRNGAALINALLLIVFNMQAGVINSERDSELSHCVPTGGPSRTWAGSGRKRTDSRFEFQRRLANPQRKFRGVRIARPLFCGSSSLKSRKALEEAASTNAALLDRSKSHFALAQKATSTWAPLHLISQLTFAQTHD
jgi:hypothetical protein